MGFLTNWDADDIFAYNTVKIVSVRDRRLGLLYLGFLFCIVLYIVFYNLLWEKKYLAVDSPAGSFRVSLRRSATPRDLADLPYCLQTNPTLNGFPNHECKYYGDELVVYPKTEESAMMCSTRITRDERTAFCDFSTPSCGFNITTPASTIYIADIERFTLMIDHAIYSTSLELQANAKNIEGSLVDLNGEPIPLSPPNQIGLKDQLDIVELGVLLNASGTPSLDITDDPEASNPESLRYAGTILMILIDYTNRVSFDTSHFEYTISVRRVKDTEFKSEELQFIEFPTSYEYWNRHGIRLIFLRLGTVGAFDFQTMLINIIAGSALLGATTYVVDFLAKYVLPEREMYRAYMIQPTADFSTLRDDPEKMRLLADGDPAAERDYTAIQGSGKVNPA